MRSRATARNHRLTRQESLPPGPFYPVFRLLEDGLKKHMTNIDRPQEMSARLRRAYRCRAAGWLTTSSFSVTLVGVDISQTHVHTRSFNIRTFECKIQQAFRRPDAETSLTIPSHPPIASHLPLGCHSTVLIPSPHQEPKLGFDPTARSAPFAAAAAAPRLVVDGKFVEEERVRWWFGF
jgi:hypothetical protein